MMTNTNTAAAETHALNIKLADRYAELERLENLGDLASPESLLQVQWEIDQLNVLSARRMGLLVG